MSHHTYNHKTSYTNHQQDSGGPPMDVREIMITQPTTVSPDDDIATAVWLMDQHNVRNLFVVDDQQRLLGTLSAYQLTKVVLPRAVSLDAARLHSLDFVHYSMEALQERLLDIRHRRVRDLMEPKDRVPVAHVDTPIVEGVLMLHRCGTRVAVVDNHDKLVGAITYRRLMDLIHRDYEEHP